MIAVDNTEESVHAADVAGRLFGADAEYMAVSVVDVDVGAVEPQWWGGAWGARYPVPYGAVWPLAGLVHSRTAGTRVDVDDSPAQLAQRAAEDTARRAVEESELTTADTVGEIGDAADVITSAAQERSADVIVLGTHDRSWFDRLLHRSVGKHVLEQSRVPVLVIPPRGD